MVYRKENGVFVPYANNSGQNVAADINIIDKNGKVVSAGGTTNIQALVSKISDDTVELSSDLASVLPSYVEASGATYSALFNAIGLLVDMSKMTPKASLVVADGGNFNTVTVYNCVGYTTRYAIFQGTSISNDWTSYYVNRILVDKQGTSSLYVNAKTTTAGAVTISDYSSTALSANSKGRLYYN